MQPPETFLSSESNGKPLANNRASLGQDEISRERMGTIIQWQYDLSLLSPL